MVEGGNFPHKGTEVLAGFLVDIAERQRSSGKSGSRSFRRLSQAAPAELMRNTSASDGRLTVSDGTTCGHFSYCRLVVSDI